MTMNTDRLDVLEILVGHAMSMEGVVMISREIIKVARDIQYDSSDEEREALSALDARLEAYKLRAMLSEALRHWILRTPYLEEAAVAWQMAQTLGLSV